MRSMGPREIVEALPLLELLAEVNLVGVAEQLVELGGIRSVRALDLPVQARRAWLDVSVLDPNILDVPVKPCLEFMTIVRADLADAEREAIDHAVDEIDRAVLVVAGQESPPHDSSPLPGRRGQGGPGRGANQRGKKPAPSLH